MSFKCLHIADVHFRGLKRHDEYRVVFSKLFEKAKELQPDLIFVGGDIVHSKTQGISPELINILNWWFTGLAQIAPTHVILGNHDGLILNQNRLDAITPVVEALNNPRLFLYKKSGVYPTGIPGFNWCVFSCFDEDGWVNVLPVDGEINIATFHGAVYGSLTDVDWELSGDVDLAFFKDYDFVFLGDIHKRQFLDFEQRVAYSGSTIQQNYGEETDKGFLLWEINSKVDYKTKFYGIENPHPFVTVEWQDNLEKTLELCNTYKNGSRFRVKSKSALNQNDVKLVQTYLREKKKAKEIIFKHEGVEQSVKHLEDTRKTFNIWDNESRLKMLKDYFKESITEAQLLKINQMFVDGLDHMPEEQNRRPNQWEILNFEFDNLFSYGEDNVINFENMNGIIGIFGKNAAGKSSIPGSMMYTLFNGTDRGAMKNLHVINTRKEYATAKMTINVNHQKYLIERSTKKIPIKKKNEIYAPTELALHKIAEDGSIVNESDEQRRETEKVLRELIGNSEEFLMTSFASQGNINAFINEKSGARKYYLSKFMNLDVFEELGRIAKDKITELKGKLKAFQEKDWSSLKKKSAEEISLNESKMTDLQTLLTDFKSREVEIRILLENVKNKNSNFELIRELENEIENLQISLDKAQDTKSKTLTEIDELTLKIEKFTKFCEQVDINELKSEKDRLTNLRSQLTIVMSQLADNQKEIQKKKDAHKLLSSVPCGDSFPTCRFIKNAYADYHDIGNAEQRMQQLSGTADELGTIIREIEQAQIQVKIDKYEEHLRKNHQNVLQKGNLEQRLDTLEQKILSEAQRHEKAHDKLSGLKMTVNESEADNLSRYQHELTSVKQSLSKTETDIIGIKGQNSYLTKMIETYEREEKIYSEIVEEWKLHELFINCVSKKGLPAKLMKEMLPSLNKEVKEILAGVADFTVDIEIQDDDLEVYLNYGADQRRIIECASGMEKMISSMAIRVGLINISNLPKSNIFIIDEGFGALDDTNIESCVRLLESFKKFFKTILIISHVDAIKDVVDDNLNIESDGKDSYVRFE
jgi:DNA repair exonuclease SbcCD ATPase subunit